MHYHFENNGSLSRFYKCKTVKEVRNVYVKYYLYLNIRKIILSKINLSFSLTHKLNSIYQICLPSFLAILGLHILEYIILKYII